MTSKFKIALATSIAASLVACGGSGDDTKVTQPTNPPVVKPPVTPPSVTPADLQTTVPALTYAAGSQEYALVNAFNAFRAAAGLGLLAQNSSLDKAAANHLKYVNAHASYYGGPVDMQAMHATHNMPVFHVEDSARAGFTGTLSLDRANFAGYGGSYVGEFGSYGNAAESFATLLATIYHRQGLMFQSPRDIGIAVGADQFQTAVIEVGYVQKGQSNASDYVGVYPADKQTMVPLFSGAETPNPYTDIVNNTAADVAKATSYPITLTVKEFAELTTTSFTVTEEGQSLPLKTRLFTRATDARVGGNFATVVGYAPFKPNTKYTVNFIGTVNGQNVARTWAFTTANSCSSLSTCT